MKLQIYLADKKLFITGLIFIITIASCAAPKPLKEDKRNRASWLFYLKEGATIRYESLLHLRILAKTNISAFQYEPSSAVSIDNGKIIEKTVTFTYINDSEHGFRATVIFQYRKFLSAGRIIYTEPKCISNKWGTH